MDSEDRDFKIYKLTKCALSLHNMAVQIKQLSSGISGELSSSYLREVENDAHVNDGKTCLPTPYVKKLMQLMVSECSIFLELSEEYEKLKKE
jgi:hypothetical protein